MPVIRDNLDLDKQDISGKHIMMDKCILDCMLFCKQNIITQIAFWLCNRDTTSFIAFAGAAIASVTGAVFSRIIIGSFCDLAGPRYGHGILQLLTASATFSMALVTNSTGFIIVRKFIGFSLATFVACQFW